MVHVGRDCRIVDAIDEAGEALEKAQAEASAAFDRHAINAPEKWPGWEPSETREMTDGHPVFAISGMRWEMDAAGNHRVVDADGRGGDWSGYESPCVSPCGNYVAFTGYWEGSLPIERLIRIEVVPHRPSESNTATAIGGRASPTPALGDMLRPFLSEILSGPQESSTDGPATTLAEMLSDLAATERRYLQALITAGVVEPAAAEPSAQRGWSTPPCVRGSGDQWWFCDETGDDHGSYSSERSACLHMHAYCVDQLDPRHVVPAALAANE